MMACWIVLAVAAGVIQAGLLARAAHRGPAPLALLVRLLLVGVVLCSAARAGYLVPATAGWAVGFVTTAVVLVRRRR